MALHHGFFILEQSYLTNPEGLIGFLWQKVQRDFECVYCGRQFQSGMAAQKHMRDKGHVYQSLADFGEEYGKYYDIELLQFDILEWAINDNSNSNITKLKDDNDSFQQPSAAFSASKQSFSVVSSDDDNNQEGDEQSFDELKLSNWDSVKDANNQVESCSFETAHCNQKLSQIEINNNNKNNKLGCVKVKSNGELLLPNGIRVGHRIYRKFYRQYFRERGDRLSGSVSRSYSSILRQSTQHAVEAEKGFRKYDLLLALSKRAAHQEFIFNKMVIKMKLKDNVKSNNQKYFRKQFQI